MALLVLSFLLVLLSSASASACDRCLHQTKATYTSQISSGSCGYGPLALEFNGGLLAAGLPKLFKEGAGCGACFKVRCKDKNLCRSQGTAVILTDTQGDARADLLLSRDAYTAMAKPGMSQNLLNLGITDIEYKKVPCEYNRNLAIKVEPYSSKPYYLATQILYQGGQTEISAIYVASVRSWRWTAMQRSYGAVWQTSSVPKGPLKFMFLVTAGHNGKYIATRQVLPWNWKSGVTYDAGVKITDLAQETCRHCDQSTW